MPQRAATIVSLPMAFEVVKAMQGDNLEWGEDYRPLARQAVAEIIEDEMAQAVDRYLDQLSLEDGPDRRNGYYPRHLLTTLGDIELAVPRTGLSCLDGALLASRFLSLMLLRGGLGAVMSPALMRGTL